MYSDPSTSPGGAAQTSDPWWKQVGRTVIGLFDAGSNPRSGGSDPCCPPGYDPPAPWPTNATVDGAPPDYRTNGSPMTDASPSGSGRKKDDFCDCIPFSFNGRWYMVGSIDATGAVRTGLPSLAERKNAVWVQVNPQTLAIIAVPGAGKTGGTTPGPGPYYPPNPTTAASIGPLALLVGAGLFARKLVRK